MGTFRQDQTMDRASTKRIQNRLLEERKRALDNLHTVECEEAEAPSVSGGDVPRYPETQADAASDTQEMESDFLLAQRESERIAEVDDALKLLLGHPVELFRCRSCGREIERERLELVPWSRTCAACARGPVGPR
jgi:RNA polymerase-binding transcription factor DksA